MATTIKDIANSLNVSEATVSRSLRNDPVISAATRARVNQLAISLGYHGSARSSRPIKSRDVSMSGEVAGMQPANKSIAIALAIQESFDMRRNGVIVQYIHGIAAECDAIGIRQTLQIVSPEGDNQRLPIYTDPGLIAATHGLQGVVFIGAAPEETVAKIATSVPVVTMARRYDAIHADAVLHDNLHGIVSAVERLANLGHRRFAFVEDHSRHVFSEERYAGFVLGCVRRGIPIEETRILHCDACIEFGLEIHLRKDALEALLAPPRPTAFVCMNDRAAWRLIAACSALGIQVPRDISVTGFDNDTTTTIDGVPRNRSLTTIDPSFIELGRYAVRLIMQRIVSPTTPSLRVFVPSVFVPGETIGPPSSY